MDLVDQIEKISTRDDFIRFLNLLIEDYEKNNEEWENNNLSLYLKALANYTNSIDANYMHRKINEDANVATWRRFADILMGATVYE